MWSCPCIAPLWTLVLNSLDAASIPHTIHSFNDLFLYIEKGNLSDLTLIIRDQIIYNTIYTIWTAYNDLMWQFEKLTGDEYTQIKDNILNDLVKRLNHHNKEAFMTLPHHSLFVDNLKKQQGLKEASASGLLVRVHLIQPLLFYSLSSLEPKFIEAYKQTWCKNNIFASIVNNIPVFNLLVVYPTPPPR